jgi:hypothetical protein
LGVKIPSTYLLPPGGVHQGPTWKDTLQNNVPNTPPSSNAGCGVSASGRCALAPRQMQNILGALLVAIPLRLLPPIPSRSMPSKPRFSLTPFRSKDEDGHYNCAGGYEDKSALVVDMVGVINLGPQISITRAR